MICKFDDIEYAKIYIVNISNINCLTRNISRLTNPLRSYYTNQSITPRGDVQEIKCNFNPGQGFFKMIVRPNLPAKNRPGVDSIVSTIRPKDPLLSTFWMRQTSNNTWVVIEILRAQKGCLLADNKPFGFHSCMAQFFQHCPRLAYPTFIKCEFVPTLHHTNGVYFEKWKELRKTVSDDPLEDIATKMTPSESLKRYGYNVDSVEEKIGIPEITYVKKQKLKTMILNKY